MLKNLSRLLCLAAVIGCTFAPVIVSADSHRSTYAQNVKRDANGKIARNPKAKAAFMKQTGFPHGRPGYVVDHIVPLKRGGADAPSNMQWQTKAAARAKDKTE